MADHSKKDEAQAQFAKTQKAEDGKKAMAEYEAAAIAIRAKTERLRALRLARDAGARQDGGPGKTATKKKVGQDRREGRGREAGRLARRPGARAAAGA